MPIAHSQGNYFLNKDQIKEIKDNEQIIFKYSSKSGDVSRKIILMVLLKVLQE